MLASNYVIQMIQQSGGNYSNLFETIETNDLFGRLVHCATGKPTDTKGASDNKTFVENQTRFLIV
jgi:hypothetical protein